MGFTIVAFPHMGNIPDRGVFPIVETIKTETVMAYNLEDFDNCITALQAATSLTLSTQHVRAFIKVCQHEGAMVTELAEMIGANMSTASRHLLDLGSRDRYNRPGFGLIESRPHATNARGNAYFLTPKGKLAKRSITRE